MTLDDELAELGVGGDPVERQAETSGRAASAGAEAETHLTVVGPETVHPMAAQWEKWKPRFAEAMDGSFHSIAGLEQLFFQGKVQFWPGRDAAIVTEIQSYVGGERALQSLWAAGDVTEVLQMIPGIEAYGRLHGCTSVLVEGRAGWAKMLKPLGYGPWSVTLRKAL